MSAKSCRVCGDDVEEAEEVIFSSNDLCEVCFELADDEE